MMIFNYLTCHLVISDVQASKYEFILSTFNPDQIYAQFNFEGGQMKYQEDFSRVIF